MSNLMLKENGWYRVTEKYIGSVDTIFREYIGEMTVSIPNLFKGWSALVTAKNSYVTMWKMVPSLTLNTKWSVVDESNPQLTPTFRDSRDNINLALPWMPPKDMRMIFAINTQEYYSYFFVFSLKTMRSTILPIPNIYDDGRLCIGEFHFSDSLIDDLDRLFVHVFDASDWNSDLLSRVKVAATRKLFSYSVDKQQLDIPENWEDYTDIISSDTINIVTTKLIEIHQPLKKEEVLF